MAKPRSFQMWRKWVSSSKIRGGEENTETDISKDASEGDYSNIKDGPIDTKNGNDGLDGKAGLMQRRESDNKMRYQYIDTKELRLMVGTWNVGGILPPPHLDLEDWLDSSPPPHIYVLGFQEIVPLNAVNVFGIENSTAQKWDTLISKSLNKKKKGDYVRISSKQMVGIFISVWILTEYYNHVRSLSLSSVGCGFMGCLGNKGAVSISLCLHQTSLCFTCCHLASGDKEGNANRRNLHVSEILKRTRFNSSIDSQPSTILAHDRIFWFGDLNYRLSLPSNEMRQLMLKEDWEALLQRDQLNAEMRSGGVFEGWMEGPILFAPTYKYIINSDQYSALADPTKGRAPAWCDRVLWHGKGLRQTEYVKTESRLSDHRPVRAVFMVEVEVLP